MEEEREGAIGEWEQRELDYARVAVHDGLLRLALVAAEKALIVSQLPRDEYVSRYAADMEHPTVLLTSKRGRQSN